MVIEKLEREKSKVIAKQFGGDYSIVSGLKNPASIRTTFYMLESGEFTFKFTGERIHEGHVGLFHGGLIASLLDEGMGRATLRFNDKELEKVIYVVTGTFTVKYLIPIELGKEMTCITREIKVDGRKHYCEGFIINENNEIMAKAEGIYISVDGKDDAGRISKDMVSTYLDEKDLKFI